MRPYFISHYAFQFHPVRHIPADSVSALLVRLRPFHQQVEVPTEVAERFYCGGGEIIELFNNENNLFIIFAFKFKS